MLQFCLQSTRAPCETLSARSYERNSRNMVCIPESQWEFRSRRSCAFGNDYLLVIPTTLRDKLLQACHDEHTAGHLGYTQNTGQSQVEKLLAKVLSVCSTVCTHVSRLPASRSATGPSFRLATTAPDSCRTIQASRYEPFGSFSTFVVWKPMDYCRNQLPHMLCRD